MAPLRTKGVNANDMKQLRHATSLGYRNFGMVPAATICRALSDNKRQKELRLIPHNLTAPSTAWEILNVGWYKCYSLAVVNVTYVP